MHIFHKWTRWVKSALVDSADKSIKGYVQERYCETCGKYEFEKFWL